MKPIRICISGQFLKVFSVWNVEEAIAWAQAGGQSLHLHRVIPNRATAPRCFVAAVDRGQDIAHLFDQDLARLKRCAYDLGVGRIVVEKIGTPRQHVDLCGRPLAMLKEIAGTIRCETCFGKGTIKAIVVKPFRFTPLFMGDDAKIVPANEETFDDVCMNCAGSGRVPIEVAEPAEKESV